MNKRKVAVNIHEYVIIVALAIIDSFNFSLLIIGNFVPLGLNGIGVLIQYLVGSESTWFSWFALIANLPISILAFIFVDKQFAVKSFLYVFTLSIAYFIISRFTDISAKYAFQPDNKLLPVIASGVLSGVIYGLVFKRNASTGGMDIIGKLVVYKKPQLNFIWVSWSFSTIVAVMCFFVMGNSFEQLILCVIFTFVATYIGNNILKGTRSAIKVEVVTVHAKEISEKIIEQLHHTATVVKAQGMYKHGEYDLLICVVNRRQLYDLEQILKPFPDTFAYISQVNSTVGLFNRERT
ncbi:MAG: YitT family protein [Clostridia bacterium]|nr:YitT family protein [Clostridia bacterium]